MIISANAAHDNTKARGEKVLLWLYLITFFGTAFMLSHMQPLYDLPPLYLNPPDEHARIRVALYVMEHGVLPTGFEPEAQIVGYGGSYAFYNYFPYLIIGYAMRLTRLFTQSDYVLLLAGRLVNNLSGTLMAYVVWKIGRAVFEDKKSGIMFACLVMFLPQHLFLHTYVNTESMSLLSLSIIIYSSVLLYKNGASTRTCVLLSIGLALCALSYYNAYGYLLVSIPLFAGAFLYKKEDGSTGLHRDDMLKKGLFVLVLTLILAGWCFIRSAIVLDGDFLGLSTMIKVQQTDGIGTRLSYYANGYSIYEFLTETTLLDTLTMSFFAMYGSMSVPATAWMYRLYKLLLAGGIACAIIYIPKALKKRDIRKIIFTVCMVVAMAVTVLLWFIYSYAKDYQPQGRYLMPVVIPLMYFVTLGYHKLGEFTGNILHCRLIGVAIQVLCICFVIAALYWYIFGSVFPLYAEAFDSWNAAFTF